MLRDQALKKWKKAKPMLLLDTGVSEILRKLPADQKTPWDLKELDDVADDLGKKSKDKKIAKEQKAIACIEEIEKDVLEDISFLRKTRKNINGKMGEIHAIARKYLNKANKNSESTKFFESFKPEADSHFKAMRRDLDDTGWIMAMRMHGDYLLDYEVLWERAKSLVIIDEDKNSKSPKFDTEATIKESLRNFTRALQRMELAQGEFEALC